MADPIAIKALKMAKEQRLRQELAAIAPYLDPNAKIYYDPTKTEIGAREFQSNTTIEVAYFPNAVSMGTYAFRQCANLKLVILPKVTAINKGNEFDDCYALEKVYLPELVELGANVFTDCQRLTALDLPKVTSMNRRAINANTGLRALILRSETMCTLDSAFLASTPIGAGTCFIYVPSALIDTYKANSVWSNHAAQFRAIEDYPEICDPTMDEPITKGEAIELVNEKMAGGGGSGGAFVVNFTWGEDSGFTADKTFEEVESAIREGSLVFARSYENYGDGEEYATQYTMTEYEGYLGYIFFTDTHNLGSAFIMNQLGMRRDGTISNSSNQMDWPTPA